MFSALFKANTRHTTIVTIAAVGLAFATPAFAEKVNLSGTHSKSEVQAACSKAGATFSDLSDGYSCNNKAKNTQLYCYNDGKCFGFVPDRQIPFDSILTGMLPAIVVDPNMSSLTTGDNSGGHNSGARDHNLANAGGMRGNTTGSMHE